MNLVPNAFKLYIFDTGILGALIQLPIESVLRYDFTFKGFLAENFILQQLSSVVNKSEGVFYCFKKGETEIEFLTDNWGSLLPIEVKAGKNLQAKSLGVFLKKFESHRALRMSQRVWDLNNDQKVIRDLPLFLAIAKEAWGGI